KMVLDNISKVILIKAFLGLTKGGIENWAHLGGLVGGGMGVTDLGGIVSNLAVGAGGGGVLSLVIGILKSMFSR
ncbi:MAG: hypothetical protein AAFR01_09465, partial [Pseudomonadota bacterium]